MPFVEWSVAVGLPVTDPETLVVLRTWQIYEVIRSFKLKTPPRLNVSEGRVAISTALTGIIILAVIQFRESLKQHLHVVQ